MLYVVLVVLFVIVLIYRKIVKPTKYWQEKDVVHTKAWPLVGSMKDVVFKKKHITNVLMDIYKKHPNDRCVGYMQFTTPFLMVKDLELIKKITIKDFDHFHDHLAFENIKSDPLLSKSLVGLGGENWRRMRGTLSPVFTANKLRIMYHLMVECAENLTCHFEGNQHYTLEMKNIFSKFANDVIATTAFGIKINSFEDPNNKFFKMGNHFTKFSLSTTLKMLLIQVAPSLANLLRIEIFPEDVGTFFRSLIKDNISTREDRGIIRPDLIHLLTEARRGRVEKEEDTEEIGNSPQLELTDDDIVAQALSFFFAGFDTVSTGASFMAHELALHPEVQKKLQIEIDEIMKKHYGKIPYEALISMKYLDQVVSETFRLWPPGFQADRRCVKDYVIEPINPKEKVVFVEKGTSVMIPIMAIHRDPEYFTDPDKFDPERFNDENRSQIIPGTYIPFGLGPRNCIGSRFALLEIKILFVYLLSKFIIVPIDETVIPLKIGSKKINMAPENGFWLGLRPRILKRD